MKELYYPCSENKGADQLRGYREADLRLCFCICRLLVFSRGGSTADQHLCFRFTDSKIYIFLKSEICFCDCTGRFVLDMVGHPDCLFSRANGQIRIILFYSNLVIALPVTF